MTDEEIMAATLPPTRAQCEVEREVIRRELSLVSVGSELERGLATARLAALERRIEEFTAAAARVTRAHDAAKHAGMEHGR